MEDKGIVSKKFIIFIIILILGLFIFWIIYSLDLDKEKVVNNPVTKTDDIIITEPDNSDNDESFMYGKFVNEDDPYSYLEITKDGYKYVMNVCEGYVTYSSEEFIFTKNISNTNGVKNVTIKLSSNTKEVVNMTFIGSSTGNINVYTGTVTCSGSDKYIKTLEN